MATVKELRVIAKELGLTGYSSLRKADLISLIEEQRNANREARTNPSKEADKATADINIDNIAEAEDELYDPELHLRPEDQGVELEQLRAALEVAYARIAELELEVKAVAPITTEEMAYERNKAQCDAADEQAVAKEQAALELFKDNAKARNLVPRHTCHNNSRTVIAMIEAHPEVKRTQYGWSLTLGGVTTYHHYATSVHNMMTNYFS